MTEGDRVIVKIIVTDPHPIVREGMRATLERANDLKVVAEASDGYDAVLAANAHRPEIVILDANLPRMDTHETTLRLKAIDPAPGVLVGYVAENPFQIQQLIQAGVDGFIARNAEAVELANAVRSIHGGGKYFSGPILTCLFDGRSNGPIGPNMFGLTRRETEVLQYLAEGFSNKEIARRLDISVRTVETHRLNIRQKTQASSLKDLVRIARQLGLGEIDEPTDIAVA